jgi:transcriptional regulator GlxA family with amidase domain
VFGATAFELLRNERLEHARLAVQTGEVSLKQVAYRLQSPYQFHQRVHRPLWSATGALRCTAREGWCRF